jgi:TRAP-type mannitol/chloroaromatic compound transport system permease large subunit
MPGTRQFDLVWFGVVMTITMEMGLIHPPVGLNIFVIKNIAPDHQGQDRDEQDPGRELHRDDGLGRRL